MRAVSLVNRIEFHFVGNVARNALTLGDVDNDQCNELIVGNNSGEVAIFKGSEKVLSITGLGFISCVAVGDILNKNKNSLIIVSADGWCYIYDQPGKRTSNSEASCECEKRPQEVYKESDGLGQSKENLPNTEEGTPSRRSSFKYGKLELKCILVQRIPANAKNIVLGDIDNDGSIEVILGLTDRVVRSYRWVNEPVTIESNLAGSTTRSTQEDQSTATASMGRLVALNKWECANQIGSITLHHSGDGRPSLLIAQPGGTFMRIRCRSEDTVSNNVVDRSQEATEINETESVPSETLSGSTIDYQFLGITRMRNQNISTEILGDFKTGISENSASNSQEKSENESGKIVKRCPYAVATLDGTIMLVQDEVILWAIAVDHQVFALTKLDVTGNDHDDIVVCSWDGQTYILDQDKNSVRFHLDEPVQAFHSGFYNVSPQVPKATCLVYVTFKNSIILYYDIPIKELVCRKFEPDPEILIELYKKHGKTEEEARSSVEHLDRKTKNQLVRYLLYNNIERP